MISNAVFASEDGRGDQSEKFLGFGIERAIAIRGRIDPEKALDIDML